VGSTLANSGLAWLAVVACGLMLVAALAGFFAAESRRLAVLERLESHHAEAWRQQHATGVMLQSAAGLLAWAGALARKDGDDELSRRVFWFALADRSPALVGIPGLALLTFGFLHAG